MYTYNIHSHVQQNQVPSSAKLYRNIKPQPATYFNTHYMEPFMEVECLLPHSGKSTTGTHPAAVESRPYPQILNIQFHITLSSMLRSQLYVLSTFSDNILHTLLILITQGLWNAMSCQLVIATSVFKKHSTFILKMKVV
jgi:hypothetical protein